MISRERIEVLRKLHDIPGHREECETLVLLTALDERDAEIERLRAENADLAKGVDPWRRICASQLDKLATARAALERVNALPAIGDCFLIIRKALEELK